MAKNKKQKTNIADLVALDNAYGRKLDTKRVLKIAMVPAFYMLIIFTMFKFNIWLSLAGFIGGYLFGYLYKMPREIKQDYVMDGYAERNRSINLLTQNLMDNNKTIIQAIQVAKSRANGEFKQDLSRLEAIILNHASSLDVHNAFQTIADKYKEDVIFGLFIEQLETAIYDGRQPGREGSSVFKNIKNQHNAFFNEYKGFYADRKNALKENHFMLNAVLGLGIMVSISAVFMSQPDAKTSIAQQNMQAKIANYRDQANDRTTKAQKIQSEINDGTISDKKPKLTTYQLAQLNSEKDAEQNSANELTKKADSLDRKDKATKYKKDSSFDRFKAGFNKYGKYFFKATTGTVTFVMFSVAIVLIELKFYKQFYDDSVSTI